MSIFETPAAAAGKNIPDYAKEEMSRLALEHDVLEQSVKDALEEARALPEQCASEEDQSRFAEVIKRLRDLSGRIEKVRVGEKEPHLRRGTAVDAFFGSMMGRLFRKNKGDKAGAADVLQARLDDYLQRKIAEERRIRQEEERLAREAERAAREEAERLEAQAREAEAKAARARKAENEEKNRAAAEAAEAEAKRLRDEQELARQRVQEASAASAAKGSDLVRTRTDSGHMVTSRQEPYVEIVDSMELDAAALWPFVREDAKLAALKSWAKTVQYKRQMPGAIIEMRDRAVVR